MTTNYAPTQSTLSPVDHYNAINQYIKKVISPQLHGQFDLVNYEAKRLSDGLHYLFEMSSTLSVSDLSTGWLAIQPTIAAVLFNCHTRVIAITRDLCIVIGTIVDDKLVVDNTHVYYTPGIPPAYILQYDVLLVKVIH